MLYVTSLLQLLIQHGGLYFDLDVIMLRHLSTAHLGHKSFAIGREGHVNHGGFHGLCNAVMLARPNASFARRWLEEYRDFGDPSRGDLWSEHSVQRPVQLAAAHPDEVRVRQEDEGRAFEPAEVRKGGARKTRVSGAGAAKGAEAGRGGDGIAPVAIPAPPLARRILHGR